ncbi:hypothetical protein GCM10009798_18270 [Nocardioides panacihumi]|uniref:DUF4149 domain-containing protein n=1 Tax=Nocardioides panacihumi TaxID=400774 RepID=A0ABP5C951_9ACTN
MTGVATAVSWLWLGMVLAISFLEAPLKFRAPGLDLRTGLAIGRLVFRALNAVEVVLAVVLSAALAVGDESRAAVVAASVAVAVLAVQLVAVRPALSRRSDAVLAGAEGPRSHAHLWYVGLEVVKVLGLIVAGVLLL